MTLNAAGQLPSTSSVDAASMSIDLNSSVKRPNRRQTEVSLAELTRKIDIKTDELEKLGGCVAGSQAKLVQLRQDYANLKKQRKDINEQLKSPDEGRFAKKAELKEQVKAKREEMAKIEYTDLAYKDERKLVQRLNSLQKQYDTSTFKNASVESAIVREIDRLKRNLKRLDKYNKLKTEREELIKKEKEIDREIYTFRKDRRKIELSMQESKMQELKLITIRRELNDLSTQKKRLMTNYHRQIEDYTTYKQSQNQKKQQNDGKQVKRPSSFKHSRPNLNDDYSSDSDSCDYEPFTKEKQLCRTLMAYLQNYMTEPSRPPEHDSIGTSAAGRSTKKEESDEEGQSTGSPKHVTRKHGKKEKRRTTQAIPLEPHVMNDFERVGVVAPVNYNEVPIAFEKLKDRLQYYDNQLSLNLDFSYVNDENYASSESELTFDSARFSVMTMSEADESMSSSMGHSLSQNSGIGTFLLRNQSSSQSFDIESPKSVEGVSTASVFNSILAARLSRSSSCMNKTEFVTVGKRTSDTAEPDSDSISFDVAKLRNKSSSLSCLSANGSGGDGEQKVGQRSRDDDLETSKCTPLQDEGIDVFLSKDSSANSNTRFKI